MQLSINTLNRKTVSVFHSLSHWTESHTPLVLGLLTLLGILISLAALSTNSILTKTRSDDAWTIATHLYQGQGYTACSTSYFPFCSTGTRVTAEREPVPALMFLAAMLISPSPLAGFALEALIYLGVFFILYFGLKNQNRLLALGTGLLWLISIPVLKELGNATGDLEAAFWLAPGILFFQKARSSHRWLHWALAGAFLGLAALSRTVVSGIVVGLAVALLFEQRLGSLKLRFRQAATFVAAFALILSPWVIRNQIALGSPIFSSTLTGYNIFRQNFILAQPDYYPHYVGSEEARLAVKSLVQASNLKGNENEVQMQAFYLKAGLKIIAAHPLQYLGLVAYRFPVLWFDAGVKASYGKHLDILDFFEILQQAVFLLAAILGAVRFRKNLWPYALGVSLATAAYMLVGAQVRYLVEFMPLIVTLACWGLFARTKELAPA